MPEPRRVRTQAERDADGQAWRAVADSRPGYATWPHTRAGSPSWWARGLPDDCGRCHLEHTAHGLLELRNSRHTACVWETVSGWVWSCKRCEARGVGLESMPDALTAAVFHMRSEVPWWRRAFDR